MMGAAWITMACLTAAAPDDVMIVRARIDADALQIGGEYDIVLDVTFKDGWSGSDAGIPAPIVQLNVPPSVKLTGNVVAGYRALSRNEFLQEPYEKLVAKTPERIGFRLTGEPSDEERIALNVVAYVRSDGGDNAYFLRRRVELPVAPLASATGRPSEKSHWGTDDLLQIGDEVQPFSLPRADGSRLNLQDYLGKKKVVVVTYRAFW